MSFNIYCNKAELEKLLAWACSRLRLEAMPGYGREGAWLEEAAIWDQMEVLYDCVAEACRVSGKQMSHVSGKQENSVSLKQEGYGFGESGDCPQVWEYFETEKPEQLLCAVYYAAGLWRAGLHPVIAATKQELMVGAWIYGDYNLGQGMIRSEALIDGVYNKEGLWVPVSMAAMSQGRAFSDSVKEGCQAMANYVIGFDLELAQGESNSELIQELLQKKETDEEEASTPEEMLEDQGAQVESEHYIVRSFVNTYEAPADYPALERNSCHAADSSEITQFRVSSMGHQPLCVAAVERSKWKELLEEAAIRHMEHQYTLGILTDVIKGSELFAQEVTLPFGRFLLEDCSEKAVELRKAALAEAAPVEADRKLQVLKRRFAQAKTQIEQYLNLLESETVPGIPLINLLEEASEACACELDVKLSEAEAELILGKDTRGFVKEYVDAWENCCVYAPDGALCFDLSTFALEEVKTLRSLSEAAEVVIQRFLEEYNRFGYKVNFVYESGDQKAYLKTLLAYCNLLADCAYVLEVEAAEQIPEATPAEAEAATAYGRYINYRELANRVSDYFDPALLMKLSTEDREKLAMIAARTLKNGLEKVSIPIPRQMVRDWADVDEMLRQADIYTAEEPLRCKAGVGVNGAIEAICKLLKEFDLIQEWADNCSFEKLYALYGHAPSKEGYLFMLQKELADAYASLQKQQNLSEQARNNLEGIFAQLKEKEINLTPAMNQLLEQAAAIREEAYTPFHEMEKEMFGSLGLSYVEFDERYPNAMLMDFILDWKNKLTDVNAYEHFEALNAAASRMGLDQVFTLFGKCSVAREDWEEAYDIFWTQYGKEYWLEKKGFDLTNYNMVRENYLQLERVIAEDGKRVLYNQLLEKLQNSNSLLADCPVQLLSAEQMTSLLEANPDFCFDRVIVAHEEAIPEETMYTIMEHAGSMAMLAEETMDKAFSKQWIARALAKNIPLI